MSYYRRFAVALMCCMCMLIIMPEFAAADSLWRDNGANANLFTDRRARNIGDIVTIVISENSSASRSGKAENSKSTKLNIDAGIGLFSPIGTTSAGNSDSFKNQGTLNNTSTISGKMTALITGKRPNGLLEISGTQMIKQNRDEQKIIITGVIREDDITAANTIPSSSIAEAQIRIEGKGPLSDKQSQGIITQLFNFFF